MSSTVPRVVLTAPPRCLDSGFMHLVSTTKNIDQVTHVCFSEDEGERNVTSQITDATLAFIATTFPKLVGLDLLEGSEGIIDDSGGFNISQRITDAGLAEVSKLSGIKSLNLCGSREVTDAGLDHLSKLSHITELNLSCCWNITDGGLKHISKLIGITVLNLRNCSKITNSGLRNVSKLSGITSLNLSRCYEIADLGMRHLSGLSGMISLNLSWCTKITDVGFETVSKLVNITDLDLNGCSEITDDGLECISKNLSNITSLNLDSSRFNISDSGLEHLCRLSHITSLNLSSCKTTDADLEHVAKLIEITSLNLSWNCEITDAGLEHLSELSEITSLNLSHCNEITDVGLEHIYKLSGITELNLSSCELLTDVCLEHLSKLSGITSIDLANCKKITDAGLQLILKISNITSLSFYGCDKITYSAEKAATYEMYRRCEKRDRDRNNENSDRNNEKIPHEKEQREKEQREKQQREKEQRDKKQQKTNSLPIVKESALVKSTPLGVGATSTVVEVQYQGVIMAAKMYHPHVVNDRSVQRDLAAVTTLIHPNIVSTLAVIVDDKDPSKVVGLLLEKMGSSLLEATDSNPIPPSLQQVLQWCVEAACGIIGAHAMRVIHSDIKPENVMLSLSNPPVAKLTDFGTAHVMSTVATKVTSARGTGINMAPEYSDGETGPTPESDVFAFGMLLWQVLHPGIDHGLGSNLMQIGRAIDKGKRPPISPQLLPELKTLIERCWHQDPLSRPKMEKIVQILRDSIALLRSSNTIQYQPSSIWTSPNLLRNSYGNLVQNLSSLSWSVSATTTPLLLSNNITDINHPLFKFVISKLRPTPFVQRTSTFQTEYSFTHPISRIQFVHSDTSSMMFAQIHESDGKSRAANAVLKVANTPDPDSIAAIAKLQSVFEDPPVDPVTNVPNLSRILFAWHGTGANFVEAVCRDGPRPLRTTDGGFFGAGSYFALEAEYAARYAMMYGGNNVDEYSMILYAVSVSQTYPVTLERDYRRVEDPKMPKLHGFSNFYGDKAIALLPKYDSHFIPTKNYHYQHPLGNYQVDGQTKQTVAVDVDFQAIPETHPDVEGHELVIGSHLRALPIAIVYFRK